MALLGCMIFLTVLIISTNFACGIPNRPRRAGTLNEDQDALVFFERCSAILRDLRRYSQQNDLGHLAQTVGAVSLLIYTREMDSGPNYISACKWLMKHQACTLCRPLIPCTSPTLINYAHVSSVYYDLPYM